MPGRGYPARHGFCAVAPCKNTVSYHLITASFEYVVIVLHNHPPLSKFSLEDIKFFLNNGTVKMMVAVTNLGSIFLIKLPKSKYYI